MHVSSSNVARIQSSGAQSAAAVFQFPSQIPIDAAHTLDQLTARFRSIRDGLPELIKNAKDQYFRLGIPDRESRQIVVVINTDKRGIGVVDFAGARLTDFEGWNEWSSR